MNGKAAPRRHRKAVQLSPQLERRRSLRREKRRELLIHSWRVLALVSISMSLGWILLRHGWTLDSSTQVVVRGDTGIRPELVARVGGLRFPQPLLEISPGEVEQRLLRELPVQSARVERRGLPARLEVELQGQSPIAHATRQRGSRTEMGMVDARGHWIQPSQDAPSKKPTSNLTVEGWNSERREVLAELLNRRNSFGAPLLAIVLHPDGAISLRTNHLGLIHLGNDITLLPEQIAVVLQLSRTMPPQLVGGGKGAIDLSNPDRPELELPLKPGSVTD